MQDIEFDKRCAMVAVLLNPQWRIDERFVDILRYIGMEDVAAFGSAALAENDPT